MALSDLCSDQLREAQQIAVGIGDDELALADATGAAAIPALFERNDRPAAVGFEPLARTAAPADRW